MPLKTILACSFDSQKMLEASNLAGEAINITKTTAAHDGHIGLHQ